MRTQRTLRRGTRRSPISSAVLVGCALAFPATAWPAGGGSLARRLAASVGKFSNGGAPLIPTLLGVAAKYGIAMGIEKVTPDSLRKPVHVRLNGGTLSQLLDLCARQLPGYAWAPEDGVIDVFGRRERQDRSNLFNTVVPKFEVRDQTIDTASEQLEDNILNLVARPKGIVGSYLGSPALEARRITLSARRATLRRLLNLLVAADGQAVWIARVPPSRLSRLPEGGLWTIVPWSVSEPGDLLEVGRPPSH